jgi:predicted transcriptional regulator
LRITNADKVTLALLLEEGRARVEDLQFHVTLTRRQIRDALNQLVEQGAVIYENASSRYALVAVTGLGLSD